MAPGEVTLDGWSTTQSWAWRGRTHLLFQLNYSNGKFLPPSQSSSLQREFIKLHNASVLGQVLYRPFRWTQATAPVSMLNEVENGSWDLLTTPTIVLKHFYKPFSHFKLFACGSSAHPIALVHSIPFAWNAFQLHLPHTLKFKPRKNSPLWILCGPIVLSISVNAEHTTLHQNHLLKLSPPRGSEFPEGGFSGLFTFVAPART